MTPRAVYKRLVSFMAAGLLVVTQNYLIMLATGSAAMTAQVVYAQSAGERGQLQSQSLVDGFTMPNFSGGSISFSSGGTTTTIDASEMVPGASSGSASTYTATANDENALLEMGSNAESSLVTESSTYGSAYRAFTSSQDRSRPSMRNDPIFALNAEALAMANAFDACTTTESTTPATSNIHLADVRHCDVRTPPVGACNLTHTMSIMSSVLSTVNLGVASTGRVRATVDFKTGLVTYNEKPPLAATQDSVSQTLSYASVCGLPQHAFNAWPSDWNAPAFANIFVGAAQARVVESPSCSNNLVAVVEFESSSLAADAAREIGQSFSFGWGTVDSDSWSPPECYQDARAFDDPQCSATLTISDGPDLSGCVDVSGYQICEGTSSAAQFGPGPSPSISSLVKAATIGGYNCAGSGTVSTTNSAGETFTTTVDGTASDTCTTLAANTACVHTNEYCSDVGGNGFCYTTAHEYDCGTDVPVDAGVRTTSTTCSQALPECTSPTQGGGGTLSSLQCERQVGHEERWNIDHAMHVQYYGATVDIGSYGRDYYQATIDLINDTVAIQTDAVTTYVTCLGDSTFSTQTYIGDQSATFASSGCEVSVTPISSVTYYAIDSTFDASYCAGELRTLTHSNELWDPRPVTGWGGNYDGDIPVVLQQPSCDNGMVAVVRVDDTTLSANTEYKIGQRWRWGGYTKTVDDWGPQFNVDRLSEPLPNDDFCRLDVTCTSGLDVDGFAVIDGIIVGPGDPLFPLFDHPSPIAGVSNLCSSVEAAVTCGQMRPGADLSTTCNDMDQRTDCGYQSSSCAPGGYDDAGKCWAYLETHQCGYGSATATAGTCIGSMPGAGEGIISQTTESNLDMARAAAQLQVAQMAAMDSSCTMTGSGPACEIFRGDVYTCRKALNGLVNCCEKPGGADLAGYVALFMEMQKLDAALTTGEAISVMGMDVSGAYQAVRDPVVNFAQDSWDAVSEPFASAWDSFTGGQASMEAAAGASTDGAAEAAAGTMTDSVATFVGDTFGTATRDALFSQNASTGAFELGGGAAWAGTALNAVMAAYMYYQLTMLVINFLWQCTDRELELGAKRALRSCHYVGKRCTQRVGVVQVCIEDTESYCCYASPLARIVMEGAVPQLGMGWGSPASPSCSGLTIAQFTTLDWSTINLDEWVAILSSTGQLPTAPGVAADAAYSMENLTGQGSALDSDGTRQSVTDRNLQRLDGVDVDRIREDARQGQYEFNRVP